MGTCWVLVRELAGCLCQYLTQSSGKLERQAWLLPEAQQGWGVMSTRPPEAHITRQILSAAPEQGQLYIPEKLPGGAGALDITLGVGGTWMTGLGHTTACRAEL